MCGRFTQTARAEAVAEHFGLPGPPDLTHQPRYNVAPSQVVAVVGLKPDGATRGLARLRWGLVPSWANSPNAGPRPINARAETLLDKSTFRECFRSKRCLVPADGFYEWRKDGSGGKQAVHFRMRDGSPFAFAGLWDVWGTGRDKLATCCLVTVAANDLVRPVHDRMPLILALEDYARWLSHDTPVADLLTLLRPYPADRMEAVLVGPAVNKVTNDGPDCLAPAA